MAQQISKGRLWASRILSGLVILFMLFDGIFKFFANEEVIKGTTELGYQMHHLPILGILSLSAVVLYAIPRTAVLGAILLTGYFGGAAATHLRLDNPIFSHILFSIYLGVMTWAGIWLRDGDLRRLLPLKK